MTKRSNRTTRLALLAASAGFIGVFAGFNDADAGPGGFGGPRHAHPPLHKLDTDKNGTITRKEVERKRDQDLKSHDTNGDKVLSLDEFEALWLKESRERMVRRFQFLDSDGNGEVSGAEMTNKIDRLFYRLDENNDGAIAKDEIRKVRGKRRMSPMRGERGRRGDR